METFLVRVWRPDGGERPEGLRGTAVHLPSGRSLTYTESEALISFLVEAAAAGARHQSASPPSRQRSHGEQSDHLPPDQHEWGELEM